MKLVSPHKIYTCLDHRLRFLKQLMRPPSLYEARMLPEDMQVLHSCLPPPDVDLDNDWFKVFEKAGISMFRLELLKASEAITGYHSCILGLAGMWSSAAHISP